MIFFALLILAGAAGSMYALAVLIRAARAGDRRRVALSLALPALFWLAFLALFAADLKSR